MDQLVSIHTHSHMSLLDGLDSPTTLVQTVKGLGQTAITLTDHGVISGHRELQNACKEEGIKPILGVELYFAFDRFDRTPVKKRDDNTDLYSHLILLAKNQNGLKNINKIVEESWKSYYYKPLTDFELISEYSDDLIITTACMGGAAAKLILNDRLDQAEIVLRKFKELRGDDFFIELQTHNPKELNDELIAYSKRLNIPCVIATDAHYAKEEDRALEEVFLILSTHPKLGEGVTYDGSVQHKDLMDRFNYLYPDRTMTFDGIDLFLHSREQMENSMKKAGIYETDYLDATMEIANRVEGYEYYEKLDLLPVPKGKNPDKVLRDLCEAGLKKRKMSDRKDAVDRLEYELETILDKDFSTYFLIVRDIINWAKGNDVLVGTGRGSGAGSLVCYLLSITEVDPLKYELLFDRFINKDRIGMPDLDIDIADKDRGRVKEYIRKRFGDDNVAGIATYQEFKDKGVFKDAARSLYVPLGDVEKFLKGMETFEDCEESKEGQWFRNKYPEVMQIARKLRGRIRGGGIHAGGIVISNKPISDYAPVETRKDPSGNVSGRIPVVAYDMNEAEDVGLIKFDFLGLKTLSVLKDTMELIKQRRKIDIKLKDIDLNDSKVYESLANGFNKGVFQFETVANGKLAQKVNVSSFDQLVACSALVRPGAMDAFGNVYIARANGLQQTPSVHPIYDEITKDTYSEVLYQEQTMLVANKLAGMPWADADKLRKIISKKLSVEEMRKYKEPFVTGVSEQVSEKFANDLWDKLEKSSNYQFNKCLTGDTTVRKSTPGTTGRWDISIEDIYEIWNSKTANGAKYRDPKRGLKIATYSPDGRVRSARVAGVHKNGTKAVYELTTANGKSIRSTRNHRHLTTNGWKRLDEISIGDKVITSDFKYEMKEYNVTVGKGWNREEITNKRMLASDGRMRPCIDGSSAEYDRIVKTMPMQCAICGATEGRLEVAHLDSNNRNNTEDNLQRLCNSHHKKLDYAFGSRKKRGSKGYPTETTEVVGIEYIGDRMTYDLEMATEEHNFLANGIVTHNSHSVAYTMISYWTAWFKIHYTVEFVYALLKNEKDKDMVTEYLIEAKRLGVKVLMPHINQSDIDFTVEGDSIRFGLSSIKYISDNVGSKIISSRPYRDYKHFQEVSKTKGSGINSRAVGALDAIGAAAFDDNPRNGKEGESFYEYLGIPNFNSGLTEDFRESISDLSEFNDKDVFIFYVMAKAIKRGKGWSRIDFVDSSGTAGIFHGESSQIETGKMYLILAANNRIERYIESSQIESKGDDPLMRFLRAEELKLPDGKKAVISFSSRKTKAGKMMGSVILSSKDKTMTQALVFPGQYPMALSKLVPGRAASVALKQTKDRDALFVEEIK